MDDKYAQLAALTIDGTGWRASRDAWSAPFTPAAESDWDDYPLLADLMSWTAPGVKSNRAGSTRPRR